MRWMRSSVAPEPPTVLEPEHPLMQRFQDALKSYLLKENDRVYNEILELKANLKQNKKSYSTQMSQEMYSLELEVQQQRNTIRQYEDTLESVVKLRGEREVELKKTRELCKEQQEILNSKKREDMELLGELDALGLLCKQYEAWQNETNCELAVSQRVSEKMAVEKQQLALQQKELDVMMYKLTTAVWDLEGGLALVREQAGIKRGEREVVDARAADQAAALGALEAEHARLVQAWGAVITHVQRRDNIYTQLTTEYKELQSDFVVLNAEIEGIKREITDAMQAHEDMTVQRDRALYDMANCQRSIKIEDKRRDNLSHSMLETNTALEITDKELQQAKMENTGLVNTLKVITREIEKLTEAKLKLEWETLEQLQARMCCDKATQATAASVRALKDQARKLEMSLLGAENQQARTALQCEQMRERNVHGAALAEEGRAAVERKEAELGQEQATLTNILMEIDRKQIMLESSNKKIAHMIESLQGVEKTPSQRRVDELEKNISDTSQQLEELQQEWLRAQARVVDLTALRQQQAADMSLTSKQIQVMEYKNMKLENEISKLTEEEGSIRRSVEALQARVDQMYQQRSDDQRHREQLEAAYGHLTMDYMAQLKDAEEETMMMEEDISGLEEDKEQLAIDLHRIRKEAMSWQKMVILAAETKQKINEEKGAGSETEKMKLEIHRMQVRQAQLTRLGRRLAEELAMGVSRREAAAGRAVTDPRRRRLALPHALRDKRAEVRRVQQEIEMNKSVLEALCREDAFLQQQLGDRRRHMADTRALIDTIRTELEEVQVTKQKNLERLVFRQRTARRWGAVGAGRGTAAPGGVAELDRQAHTRRALTALATALIPSCHKARRVLVTLAADTDTSGGVLPDLPPRDCVCSPGDM